MNDLDLFNAALRGPWITAGRDVQLRAEFPVEGRVRFFFECSASRSDWIHNFKAWARVVFRRARAPYKRMPEPWAAHAGFVELYRSVRELVRALAAGSPEVEVYGYSQGAALALLAAEDLAFEGRRVRGVAFAAPRVFLGRPRAVLRRIAGVRVVNRRDDLVAFVPPWFSHGVRAERIGPRAIIPGAGGHYPERYREALG